MCCDQICDQGLPRIGGRSVEAVMARRAVPVDLNRDALVRVPDPVAGDLCVDAAVQRERRVGVPDVVQPDPSHPREVNQPVEAPGHGAACRRRPSSYRISLLCALSGDGRITTSDCQPWERSTLTRIVTSVNGTERSSVRRGTGVRDEEVVRTERI
jgi:hypothetical protein